jgi:hypothetical protein
LEPVRIAVSFPLSPFLPALLLVVALGLGGAMVTQLVTGRHYPRGLGWLHAAIALLGVILLAFVALSGPAEAWLDDGALFSVMAAFGGAVLGITTGRRGERPFGVLVFLHALFALFGFALLVVALVRLGGRA